MKLQKFTLLALLFGMFLIFPTQNSISVSTGSFKYEVKDKKTKLDLKSSNLTRQKKKKTSWFKRLLAKLKIKKTPFKTNQATPAELATWSLILGVGAAALMLIGFTVLQLYAWRFAFFGLLMAIPGSIIGKHALRRIKLFPEYGEHEWKARTGRFFSFLVIIGWVILILWLIWFLNNITD